MQDQSTMRGACPEDYFHPRPIDTTDPRSIVSYPYGPLGLTHQPAPRWWQARLAQYGYACAYCGRTDPALQRDHVIPRALGGPNHRDNIVPCCAPCNQRKGTQTWTPRVPDE